MSVYIYHYIDSCEYLVYTGAPARESLVRSQQSNNPHIVGQPTSVDRQRTSHVTAIKINTTYINHFISQPTQMEKGILQSTLFSL